MKWIYISLTLIFSYSSYAITELTLKFKNLTGKMYPVSISLVYKGEVKSRMHELDSFSIMLMP